MPVIERSIKAYLQKLQQIKEIVVAQVLTFPKAIIYLLSNFCLGDPGLEFYILAKPYIIGSTVSKKMSHQNV